MFIEPHAVSPFQMSVRRPNRVQNYFQYRSMLRRYPNFIHHGKWTNELDANDKNRGDLLDICNAALKRDLGVVIGYGWWNRWDHEDNKRKTKRIGMLKVKRDNIIAELMPNTQIEPEMEARVAKILMIHNEDKANYFGVKKLVQNLKEIFIDDLSYEMCYGHAAVCPQSGYPVTGKDDRFSWARTMKINHSDGQGSFKISRLTETWVKTGFTLIPSPERDDELALALLSKSYTDRLLQGIHANYWAQFF